jgi:hypothetical protein
VVFAGSGIPGLSSSQLKPSRLPVPVQLLPHERSFSPATSTQCPLLHSVSLTQTHAPPPAHAEPVLPLQLPSGQVE